MLINRHRQPLTALVGLLLTTHAFGVESESDKLHVQAHDLRVKAAQLHQQALNEIEDADAKQVESDHAYKDAAALDMKIDALDKVTPDQARARTLRHQAHLDERQAETDESAAKIHGQRSKRDEERSDDAAQMVKDLKSKNADAAELKLIEEDASENQKKAKEEEDGAKHFESEAARLKKAAASLIAQADKLDPAGKDVDRNEHPPATKK